MVERAQPGRAEREALMPRVGLRWKILLLTALPLLALAGATLWFVDRAVTKRSQEDIAGDLRRASHVFENMLAASANELSVAGAVIVSDPRFFSVLALPHGRRDREFVATVTGVAHDFQKLAQLDVFEIVDSRGERVASGSRAGPESWRSRSSTRRCCSRARRSAWTAASSARCSWGAR